MILKNIVIFDIDGLRPDVLAEALAFRTVPNIARLLEPQGYHQHLLCPAPSITFTCQGSIILGAHPKTHGIVGNQFFDRLGKLSHGKPKYYGLDVGDSLSYDDAVAVFLGRQGLANRLIPKDLPTLFEKLSEIGWTSAPVHFMYGRGATKWVRPSVVDLARFKRANSFLGLSPEAFDTRMISKLQKLLQQDLKPNLLLLYFMGLDFMSHNYGPTAQAEYLAKVIDPQIGTITKALVSAGYKENTAYIFVSDHGQIAVRSDPEHGLRVGHSLLRTPSILSQAFERSGGRRLLRFPLPDEKADTILTPNGGLAHVYLRSANFDWKTPPSFTQDVLPCARELYKASQSVDFPSLSDRAFSAILVRNIEQHGWGAPFLGLSDTHEPISLEQLFENPRFAMLEEPLMRLRQLEAPEAGDIILIANGADGFYFGPRCLGNHGGLHRDESLSVFSVGIPNCSPTDWRIFKSALSTELQNLKQAEARSFNSLTDISPTLLHLVAKFGSKEKML